MTVLDRKRTTQAQPRQERPAPPITKQVPEREPPAFAWLVIVGATFAAVVLKESLGRIGGPVVVTVRSIPRLPAAFWTALIVGGLERIGARVLGLRIGQG